MKFNKQIAIIIVLASFLFSAIGVAFYMYKQNQAIIADSNKKVLVYIANKDIKKNMPITKEDIKKHYITKQELLDKPLSEKEIVGKYAKIDIVKNDIFKKERITSKIEIKKKKEDIVKYKKNGLNLALKYFRNPNYIVKQNDIIDIVSVYGVKSGPSVQYVARNIKILGFLIKKKPSSTISKEMEVTVMVNKKPEKQKKEIYADEMIVDMDNKTILSVIEDYNKGSQLWMVKTDFKVQKKKPKKPEPAIVKKEEIKKPKVAANVVKKEKKIKKAKRVKKVYPYVMYKSKKSISTLSAVIEYMDQADKKAQVKKAQIVKNYDKECDENRDNLIVCIADNVFMRYGPSLKEKVFEVINRNYIIPYIKKEGKWYRTCNGKYIHENEAKPIKVETALKKLGK